MACMTCDGSAIPRSPSARQLLQADHHHDHKGSWLLSSLDVKTFCYSLESKEDMKYFDLHYMAEQGRAILSVLLSFPREDSSNITNIVLSYPNR
jgi:hypothetical protein